MTNPNPNPFPVTIDFGPSGWTVDPPLASINVPDTYIEFKLSASGYRFSDPTLGATPPEPPAITFDDGFPSDSFVGPWTVSESAASLLDTLVVRGRTYKYHVNLVQMGTSERLVVPSGTPPAIVNK